MSHIKNNQIIHQGATFRWQLIVRDSGGVPIDLTGANVVMQVRRAHRADEILLEASTFNGKITLDAANGVISILVPDEETALLSVTEAVYDVLVLWPDGFTTRLQEGNMRVSLGVSRSWQT